MTRADLLHEIGEMSLDEKLSLVEAIWTQITIDSTGLPVPASHDAELQRRHADHLADPDDTVDWQVLRADLEWGR